MDFDEHEDQDGNDDMGMSIPPPNYDSLTNSATPKINSAATAQQPPPAAAHHRRPVRYRECLKNHAVSIGGHAVDGCGEFIAAGEEGTLDALKCAACNCHRNFHRKEAGDGGGGRHQQHQHQPQFSSYYRPPPPAGYLHLQSMPLHQPLALPAASGGVGGVGGDEDASNPSSSGGFSGGSKKRFRTKFTAEQKEKMHEFAERLGWRIQKHDESAVAQFCAETGVKRQVLKVWMHNNKNTVGKKP